MCDLICDVITCCVLSCGKINASYKITFRNHKTIKCGNKRYFEINLHLNDSLDRINSLFRRADARGSAVIIYCLRLRNDLYCVEWGVKLYSLTHSLVIIYCI